MSLLNPGRLVMSAVAILIPAGAFSADWSHTHVFNPRWPPHAKFHNGQTMSMSVALGLATLYYTWRPAKALQIRRESLWIAAVINSMYAVTGISAILYPGSLAIDPEFGEGFPQLYLFGGLFLANWVGWFVDTRRLLQNEGRKGK